MKVGIVGGGIIGLTTGVVLAEAGHDVSIYAREPIEASTSWAAGATCYPFGCEESDRAVEWSLKTHSILKALQINPEAGIYNADWQKLSENETCEHPFWLDRFEGGRVLGADEVPAPYKSGIAAKLLIMGVDEYAPYIARRFASAGGRMEQRDVKADTDIEASVVVNTTGVFAKEFVGDESIYPARGQVVVVKNPGVQKHTALFDKKFYLYPRGPQCLLGGSFDEHEWDRARDKALSAEILEWASEFEPLLRDPEILDVRVGLRPMRPTVRLEMEAVEDGRVLIHNYGHGGAGYTLSWGCAEEVLQMLESL